MTAEPREQLADTFERVLDAGSGWVQGTLGETVLRVRYVDHGVGSTRDPYTEVVIEGPPSLELYLNVVPETEEDSRDVAKGLGTDLVLGDGEFDRRYLVEAGPAHMTRLIFDPGIRSAMLADFPCCVWTRSARCGGQRGAPRLDMHVTRRMRRRRAHDLGVAWCAARTASVRRPRSADAPPGLR